MRSRRPRPSNAIPGIFLLILSIASTPAWPLGVTGEADRPEVMVGEPVVVTVTGSRSDSEDDPNFVGAGIQVAPLWQRGGQTAMSARHDGASERKSWQFELIAVAPGTTFVTPVVYIGSTPSLDMQADSVLGAPITLVILPLPEPVIWPYFLGAAVLVVGITYLAARSRKRRRAAAYERPTVPPLEEALATLESIRVNRREDRAVQYLSDLERVIQGYLSRRLGTGLGGHTAAEIADQVAGHVADEDTVAKLLEILRQCAASKFGGQRIDFNALTALDDEVSGLLEQMDHKWV
jgi:hypothetical protein